MPRHLVGRTVESEVVTRFLESGPESALVMSGEPGIGKTILWGWAVARARSTGRNVLTVRPSAAESGLAFAGLTDLLAPVGDEILGRIPTPQRAALEAAMLRQDLDTDGYDHRAVCAATSSVVNILADRRRLVLAIDDAQWLDRPTSSVLEFVARRLDGPAVQIIVAQRAERSGLHLFDAMHDQELVGLWVGPLPASELITVVRDRLQTTLPLRIINRITELSAGNPFYALELAQWLQDRPERTPETAGLPRGLQELVRARIARLSRETRRLLLIVAAAHAPTLELVRSASDMTTEHVQECLDTAVAAGVIDLGRPPGSRLTFAHPLYAAGVYAQSAPRERRRTHGRLAGLVTDIEERGQHLAQRATGRDGELANLLDQACEHARRRGAPETAGDFAEQALEFTPVEHGEDVARRALAAAEYRFHAGDIAKAQALLQRATSSRLSKRQHAEALRQLGEIRYHQESFPEATALFEQSLAYAEGDSELTCRLRLLMAFAAVSVLDFVAAQSNAHIAVELLAGSDEAALMSEALAVVTIADFMSGDGLDEQRLRRALELEDPFRQIAVALRPSLIAGCLFLYIGRLAEAVQWFSAVRAGVLERGDDSDLPFLSSTLSWALCWSGHLDVAAAATEEALDTAARLASTSAECVALGYGSVTSAYRGDVDLARSRAARSLALAEQAGGSSAELWARWGWMLAELSAGETAAAIAAAEPFLTMVEREGLPEPVRVVLLADAIEALIAEGQLARAQQLLDVLSTAARRLDRQWATVGARRGQALWHAAQGDLESAWVCAESALAECRYLELELEVARTYLVAGEIARRRRRRKVAGELLLQAHRRFVRCGATLWARRAQEELNRASPSRVSGRQLTVTEQRVADLAASGLTNRQIATRLAISSKTVEANISKVYDKLDIRSRAALGARLAREGPSPNTG